MPLRNFVAGQWLGLCSLTAVAPVQSLVGELRFLKLQRVAKQTNKQKDASHRYRLRWLSVAATKCQKAESWMMGEIPLHTPGSGRPQSLLRKCQVGRPSPGIDPHCQQTKIPHSPVPNLPACFWGFFCPSVQWAHWTHFIFF